MCLFTRTIYDKLSLTVLLKLTACDLSTTLFLKGYRFEQATTSSQDLGYREPDAVENRG